MKTKKLTIKTIGYELRPIPYRFIQKASFSIKSATEILLTVFTVINFLFTYSFGLKAQTPNNLGESSAPLSSLSTGLVLYYPMNGNANDFSGNNINGNIVGGVTAVNDRFGTASSSLSFNGSSGHITVPAGVYFDGGDFTVSCWVRKTANNSWSRLFDFGNGQANNNVFTAITNATTGNPASRIYQGNTNVGQVNSSTILALNQWQLLTYTWTANTGTLYINGNMVAQGTQQAPLNVVRNINYIGRSNWSVDGYAQGRFDDFRIYNRVLSAAEINSLVLEQPNPLTATVQPNDSICEGTSAQIILSNTQLGVSYQLVNTNTSANVGAAQTGTGGSLTFNIGVLTQTTDFHFVATYTTTGASITTNPVIKVTVNPLPAAPTTTGASICNSGSVTLNVSGAAGNGFYNWYTTPTGGTPINGVTGDTYVTPNLLESTTYYVSITDALGCEGPRSSVTATVVNPLNPPVDINSGLILHYKFDGNLADSSGNGYNATISGTHSYVNDRLANPLSAINTTAGSIPGNNFINAGNPLKVQQLTNQVTISMWIRQIQTWFGSSGLDGQMPLINKWNGSTGLWVGLRMTNPLNMQNRVRWRINGSTLLESNTNVPVGTWHHIVCTYNGSQLRIYQNGQLTGTLNYTGTIGNTAVDLNLARQANGNPPGSCTYRGDFDQVRIYNRALNINEIQTLYNNESVAFANTPLCDGEGNLALTTFSFPGASYQWTGPNGFTSNQQNPPVIVNADSATYAGVYTLQVTAQGCTSPPQQVNAVIYQIPSAPLTINDTVCGSGNAILTASGAPTGASYLWYTVAVGGTPINGETSATLTINNVTSTTTRYVSIIRNGCEGPRTPVTAVYYNDADINLTVTGSTVCSGSNATVTVNASENGVNYQAFLGTTPVSSIVVGGGNISIPVNTSGMTIGNNTITIKANYPGCGPVNLANTADVIILALPSVSITPNGPLSFCSGNSVDLSATSASSYLWSNGATTQTINVTSSGTFTVTITDANGCSNTSSAVNTTEINNPVPVISAGGPTTFCDGGSVTLSASGGSTYLWNTGSTATSINVTQSGTYNFTAFNGTCSAVSSDIVVNVLAAPNVTANASQTNICNGQSITLTGGGASSYSWSNGVIDGVPFVPAASGTYTVTGTDVNGCTGNASVSIVVNPLPDASFTSSSPSFCPGVTSMNLVAVNSNYANYDWYLNGNPLQLNGPSTITITNTGNYELWVTDNNGCTNSYSINLGTGNAPNVSISSANNSFCDGSNELITATFESGATYTWYLDGNIVFGPALGANTYTASSAGNYSVELTNSDGCVGSSNIISMSTIPLPNASISSNSTSLCLGDSVFIFAAPVNGANYQWLLNGNIITGATGSSYYATTSGNYQVIVNDGCSNTSNSITINAITVPDNAGVISGNNSFCAGQSDIFSIASVNGATYYHWSISPANAASISIGQGTNNVTVNTTNQNFTLTVTPQNACGSGNSNSLLISVSTAFPCSSEIMFAADNTNICVGSQVVYTNYTDPNLYMGLTPLWNFGAGAVPATATGNGPHTVTYNTAGLKTVTLDYVDMFNNSFGNETKVNYVNVSGTVNTSPISGDTSVSCASVNEVYSVVNTMGSTYNWSVPTGAVITGGQGTNSITVNLNGIAGTISVTETNISGCIGAPVNLQVDVPNAVNTSPISGPSIVNCSSNSETYSVVNTSGSTYNWSVPTGAVIINGQGTNTIDVNFMLNFGIVSVVETNADGCVGSPQQISVNCNMSVQEESSAAMHVYPNPSTGYFNIDLSDLNLPAMLSLFDSKGKLVKELSLNTKTTIDVTDLSRGLYLGKIKTQHGIMQFRLILND